MPRLWFFCPDFTHLQKVKMDAEGSSARRARTNLYREDKKATSQDIGFFVFVFIFL